jgi:hypothetical protein
MAFFECFLHGVQMILASYAFNGCDRTTVGLHGKQGAAFRSSAIDQDIAGAAAAGIAAHVGARQSQYIPDVLYQHHSGFNLMAVMNAINGQGNFNKHVELGFLS